MKGGDGPGRRGSAPRLFPALLPVLLAVFLLVSAGPSASAPSASAPSAPAPATGVASAGAGAAEERPRIRDLGVEPGVLSPGPLNAITDVYGVRVGHATRIEGDSVRTGVTAILPHGGNVFQEKVPAAAWVGNGFGKAAGFLQVRELGTLETPVVLTNTLAVGTAVRAVVDWTLEQPGNGEVRSVNAVVGETNDGYLNDVRASTVRPRDVRAALAAAAGAGPAKPVAEGSVGAGTGTRAFGWKGGIGTSSRRLPAELGGYTVGVLVQSNFGGVLRIDGVPVGEALGRYAYRDVLEGAAEGTGGADQAVGDRDGDHRGEGGRGEGGGERDGRGGGAGGGGGTTGPAQDGDGSVMIVLATDAPVSPPNLERLARRTLLGLGRVGSFMSNGSGDFVVAFSTAYRLPDSPASPTHTVELLHDDPLSPLFLAAVEATEEAIYNSLLRATTVTGHRGTVEAIPVDRVRELLAER